MKAILMELTIEITNKCFENCVHCSSNASIDGSMFLDVITVEKVINEINPDKVIVSGGEPLLHPNFDAIIEMISSKKIGIALNTCATFPYLEVPKNLGKINEFYVSFYYENENKNDEVTGFNPTISQFFTYQHPLGFIAFLKRNFHAENIWINTVIFDRCQIIEIPRICYYLEVPFHVMRMIQHGRAENITILPVDKQMEIAEEMLDQLNPAKLPKRPPSFLCQSLVEVTPEIKQVLEKIYPRCKISHSFYPEQCRANQKRTLLVDGRIIGCVAGKGYMDNLDVMKACNFSCEG